MPGPLPPVSKGVRFDYHYSQSGTPNMQVREFFQYSGSLSSTDAVTWAAASGSAMATFTSTVMSTTVDFVNSELTDLSSNTAPQVVDNTTGSGGVVSAALTSGTALVVRKHILRRYRGGHPRVYFCGLTEADLTNPGQWDPTFLTNFRAAYNTFIAAVIAGAPGAVGTVTHISISYFQGFTNHTYPSGRVKPIPNPRVTPLVDLIVAITMNPRVASQRRRNEQSR